MDLKTIAANMLIPHRKFKLRVLDLRNTGQDFWRMWSGSSAHVSSSSSMAPMAEDGSRIKKRLAAFEVFTELHLKERSIKTFSGASRCFVIDLGSATGALPELVHL